MDEDLAAKLLAGAKRLPPARAETLKAMLAAGGPWFPLLVEEMHRYDAGCLKDIFHLLLRNRAIRHELLPEGTGATSFFDPFNNARTGEGIRFVFPCVWRPVPLTELLDAINDACRLEHPLVLSPELGNDPSLVVQRPPAEIAGAVCVDRLLKRFGLGITFLETVALVEREGGSCYDRTYSQQKEDIVLLDRVMRILASPLSEEAQKKAAYKALAYLDPPGAVDGYFIEFSKGKSNQGLDILLYGCCIDKLIAMMVMTEDKDVGIHLMRTCCAMDEADPRRDRLHRVLFSLPTPLLSAIVNGADQVSPDRMLPFRAACGMADENEIMAVIESEDLGKRRIGFEAAYRYFICTDAHTLFELVIPILLQVSVEDSMSLQVLDRFLIPSIYRHLTDEKLAAWLNSPGVRPAVYESARRKGGPQSARACLDGISGREGDFERIRCILAIHERSAGKERGALAKAVRDAMNACGEDSSSSDVKKTSMFVLNALLSDSKEEINQAAERVADLASLGNGSARLGARLFSMIGQGRMVDYVGLWASFRQRADAAVRSELERSLLQSVGGNAMDAEKLRLAFRKRPDKDDFQRLMQDLGGLGSMYSLDSYRVLIDF